MRSLPSPVNKPQPSRPQTCDRCSRARSPLRRPRRKFWRHHRLPRPRGCGLRTTRAGSTTTCSPTVGSQVEGTPLASRSAFLAHTSEFAVQIFDLTHVWSNRDCDTVGSDDLLALAAAVHMYIKLHLSPQQRYPQSLSEQLTAFTELLVWRQPDDVPVLNNASPSRTCTPMAWVDTFRQSFTLRQQQLQEDLPSISSNRQFVLTPSLSLLVRMPQPTFGMSHSVSHPQPAKLVWLLQTNKRKRWTLQVALHPSGVFLVIII